MLEMHSPENHESLMKGLAKAVRVIPSPLALLDCRGRVVEANGQFARALGIRRGEVGRAVWELFDDTAAQRALQEMDWSGGEREYEVVRLPSRVDGGWTYQDWQRVILKVAESPLVHILFLQVPPGGWVADVEEGRRQGGGGLGRMALRMLVHELRSPLAAIHTAAQFLNELLPHDADGRRMADVIEQQASRISRFVNQVFDLVQIEQGTYPWQWEEVDLGALVNQVGRGMAVLGEKSEVKVKWTFPSSPCPMRGDRRALVVMLEEIVRNGIQHSRGGSVELELRREPDDRELILVCRDSGSGILPEIFPGVGRPFQLSGGRLDGRTIQGAGTGLALAFAILRAHGGRWTIRSSSDGTELELVLPRGGRAPEDKGRDP
ncbi:MAG: ATP-binding protein [Acidobacteriota bacterium]